MGGRVRDKSKTYFGALSLTIVWIRIQAWDLICSMIYRVFVWNIFELSCTTSCYATSSSARQILMGRRVGDKRTTESTWKSFADWQLFELDFRPESWYSSKIYMAFPLRAISSMYNILDLWLFCRSAGVSFSRQFVFVIVFCTCICICISMNTIQQADRATRGRGIITLNSWRISRQFVPPSMQMVNECICSVVVTADRCWQVCTSIDNTDEISDNLDEIFMAQNKSKKDIPPRNMQMVNDRVHLFSTLDRR